MDIVVLSQSGGTIIASPLETGTYLDTVSITQEGGTGGTFSVTSIETGTYQDTVAISLVGGDTTPDGFDFTDQVGVPVSTYIVSNSQTITGIEAPATVSSLTGGLEYRVNSGGWVSGTGGTIGNGQSVDVRLMSAATYETQTSGAITIGGVSDTFSVTTETAPVLMESRMALEQFVGTGSIPLAPGVLGLSGFTLVSSSVSPVGYEVSEITPAYVNYIDEYGEKHLTRTDRVDIKTGPEYLKNGTLRFVAGNKRSNPVTMSILRNGVSIWSNTFTGVTANQVFTTPYVGGTDLTFTIAITSPTFPAEAEVVIIGVSEIAWLEDNIPYVVETFSSFPVGTIGGGVSGLHGTWSGTASISTTYSTKLGTELVFYRNSDGTTNQLHTAELAMGSVPSGRIQFLMERTSGSAAPLSVYADNVLIGTVPSSTFSANTLRSASFPFVGGGPVVFRFELGLPAATGLGQVSISNLAVTR
jgi:hypothetical protein